MTKRKIFLSTLGTALLALPLMAGNCTPEGGADCSAETDCSTEEHCHPTLKVCVSNCKKVDGACDTETGTSCAEADINSLAFNGICVCDPANDTCPDGEKCNPYDLACDMPCTGDTDCSDYPADQDRTCQDSSGTMFCLLPSGDCRPNPTSCATGTVCDDRTGSDTAGQCIAECTATSCTGSQVCNTSTHLCQDPCTAGSCGAGYYCDDARFGSTNLCLAQPTSCSNDDCLTDDQLCDLATGETLNLCVDPDDATNTCSAAGARDSGGPIMYVDDPSTDIEEVSAANDPNDCTDTTTNTLMEITFTLDGAVAREFQDTYWSNPPSTTWANPYYATTSSSGGYTFLFVDMCFQSASPWTRAFYHDATAGETNRVCVDISN